MNVQKFLSGQNVQFETLEHPVEYSAQRMAGVIHVSGDEVAKTVVLKVDGKPMLAVLQATHAVDFDKAPEVFGAETVELAPEEELRELFPDCELGAVPPFGSQYGLPTVVDEPLTKDETIVFEGNTHHDAIRMRYADYAKLENPRVASFSRHT